MSSIFSARRAAWEKSRDAGSNTAAKQTIFVRVMGTPSLTRKVRQGADPLGRGCFTQLENPGPRPQYTAAKQTIFVRVMGTPSLTRKVRQAAYPLVRGCLTELEIAARRPLQAEKMPFARSAWRFRLPISLAGAWRHEQLMPPTAGASRCPPAQSPRTSRYGHRW